MQVIKAPENRPNDDTIKVFMGGSIEMGKAEDWQTRLANYFKDNNTVTFWNPRRDDWDSSWEQDPTEGTQFHEQVQWELDAQDDADYIVYYFDPETQAPITLLELGSYGSQNAKNVIVCCPDGYFRKGNVVMFCNHHDIKIVDTFNELVDELAKIII